MLYHFRTKSRLNVNHFVCTFAFTGKEAALPPPSNDLLCCCFSIDTHTPPRVPRSGNNVTSNERFTPQSWCVNFQRVHYCLRTNESLPITKATLSLSDWRLYPRTNQFPSQMHKIVCFFYRDHHAMQHFSHRGASQTLHYESHCCSRPPLPFDFFQWTKAKIFLSFSAAGRRRHFRQTKKNCTI